jgi:hypothetical protein
MQHNRWTSTRFNFSLVYDRRIWVFAMCSEVNLTFHLNIVGVDQT